MTIDTLIALVARTLKRSVALIKTHVIISVILCSVVIGGVAYQLFISNKEAEVIRTVHPKSFVQEISVSGRVEAQNDVEMSFENSGRVANVFVKVGDTVEEGDKLVALSSGTLRAQLLAAQAEVISRENERANSVVNLDEVRNQENTKVQSAYTALLSTNLTATPQTDTYGVTAPVITGLYAGAQEGTYKFRLRTTGTGSNLELLVFDLETTEPLVVSETKPTALGTKGLFLTFPDDLTSYQDTTWFVDIPNIKSSSYADLRATYDEALRARAVAIETAQATLARRAQVGIADAALTSAQAEVERLTAELAKYTMSAPFTGTVTFMDVEEGDTVPANTPVVSVMTVDKLLIESFVPEIHISSLAVGNTAKITLDAYGENQIFSARVVAIDPAETLRDGVSTYRAHLSFDTLDPRIRPGMTANIVITTDRREGVLSVPVGAITREQGQAFVTVLEGKKREKRAVILGAVSSLGEIEIISGLMAGDMVVLAP